MTPRLTRLAAQRMRPARRADVAYCVGLLLAGAVTLWSGVAAQRHLSPGAAVQVSQTLDELELPRALPNSVLKRDDGVEMRLHELAGESRSIVTFYAPW